jgi:hypothetical protein
MSEWQPIETATFDGQLAHITRSVPEDLIFVGFATLDEAFQARLATMTATADALVANGSAHPY